MISPGKTRYKVKPTAFLPNEAALQGKSRCMLGVSMSNPVFWRSSIYELLAWQVQHFNVTLLVVGDHLHRHNELMAEGTTREAAEAVALQKGENFLEHFSLYNSEFNPKSFGWLRWQEVTRKEGFASALAHFKSLCKENEAVCASLESTAKSFVKQHETLAGTPEPKAVQHSLDYLLEELAAFEVLAQEGWEVLAYPGKQLPFFHQLLSGELGDLKLKLQNCAFIELSVQKKG